MKKLAVTLMTLILVFSCTKKTEQPKDETSEPENKKEKSTTTDSDLDIISYRLGFNSALVILKDFPSANPEAMSRGIKDAFKDGLKPKYNDNDFNRSLAKYRKNKVSVDAKKRLPEFIKNNPLSEKFMEKHAKRKGVGEVKDGVLIEVLQKGNGEKVTMNDLVKVNYKGWDANGKLFDSSHIRKRPSVFNLNNLIKGLQIAFLEMKKDGKYNVFIPQKLGYGSTGFRERVESGMALKFEVQVLDVKRNAAKEPIK